MSETAESRAAILSEARAPIYRVILLAGCGTVRNIVRLSADDDDQARDRAKMMVDGHAVELWDGLRFIDHFAPVEGGSRPCLTTDPCLTTNPCLTTETDPCG